jgi:hypothetical protein
MATFLKKKNKEIERKKKKKWHPTNLQVQLFTGVLLFVMVGLFVTLVWYVTRIQSLQIERIEVIGGETIPHAQIQAKVEAVLAGTYMRLIPKRFIFLYPRTEVVNSLATFERIKNMHIERTKDNTLTIVFDEHIPFGLWCAHGEDAECLFIDRTGLAFAQAPALEGSAFVRFIDDGATPAVDTVGFQSAFMRDAELFIEMLQERLGLYVTHVYKRGTYDIEYGISGGGIIKVSQSISMQESFENLETILLSEQFMHIEPGAFQYIDLRFGDKVFVNEEFSSDAAIGTSTVSSSNQE